MNLRRKKMSQKQTASSDQILLFPHVLEQRRGVFDLGAGVPEIEDVVPSRGTSVVLCGTYRKDPDGLRRAFEHLQELGFSILSPSNPFIETEKEGFVYMQNESTQSPDQIENKHLDAIQNADFVWFFAPDGYVGPTGALEVGFAHANGIPVYSNVVPDDTTLQQFIEVVDSPATVFESFRKNRVLPPLPAVRSFQYYYKRAALQRGYTKENATDCLMLMVEEVGELARALRKRAKLTRHGKGIVNQEGLELADVFIYVVHMANILKIDLSKIVQDKELININKLVNGK
jgi:NTP pyrophosphatase (non-canonical NTP hydrolase)